jgi:hypothetical protein
VSRSLRLRSRKVGGCLPGRGHCSAGDPIAGLLSRGRERDLPGFQAVHPVPLPRSRTPAESTIPRLFVGLVDAAPASRTAKASACQLFRGSITRLQHLLPTLQEWCCHHPCKARFRLAGLPLPGGSRTLWIALKGFRSHFHSPFLDFSWRYRDELSPSHPAPLTPHYGQPIALGASCLALRRRFFQSFSCSAGGVCAGFRMPAIDSRATFTGGRRPKAAKERTCGG